LGGRVGGAKVREYDRFIPETRNGRGKGKSVTYQGGRPFRQIKRKE